MIDLPALSFRGRLPRAGFWWTCSLALGAAAALTIALQPVVGRHAAWLVTPLLAWILAATAVQRCRDLDRSPHWLWLLLVPAAGPLLVGWWLGFRPGRRSGYLQVELARPDLVNDVTGLNPVSVNATVRPTSVEEVQRLIRDSEGPISLGGGHFSMGGQVASPGSLHLDLRALDRVLEIDAGEGRARVQAGVRWCDLQAAIDPHELSVAIMQTYANFTIGGALSVNCHGRYVGRGPLVLSVLEIRLVLADGTLVTASRTEHPELFWGAIGGYGGLGVIVEATLELAQNRRVERNAQVLPTAAYPAHFAAEIREHAAAVFHNADLYPPHYARANAVTWTETSRPATVKRRLQRPSRFHGATRYMLWAISETPGGPWRREHLIDPLLFRGRPVHPRNYEAGYDVAELEPRSRARSTYVLQEYFVPVEHFAAFVGPMAEIFRRHRVQVINVSVRHARPDPGTLLAWAPRECFAFVVYHKQRTTPAARVEVGVWTRELIDAALACGGTYYLPYQPHATRAQFHRAYPRAREYAALKRRVDPQHRFRSALSDKYHQAAEPAEPGETALPEPIGDFRQVYRDPLARDRFLLFLQNVFHLFPADRFHALIAKACSEQPDDEAIYRAVAAQLPSIRPPLGLLTHALPALAKQKREMARQVRELVGARTTFDGYVEVGTPGRYVRPLRTVLQLGGRTVLINDLAPSSSPADVAERGQVRQVGEFLPLAGYAPVDPARLPEASVDLITCFIGLHHCPPDRLRPFLASLARALRPGGLFVLRDHAASDSAQVAFVALAHAVFNAGLGVSWEENSRELRHFAPIAHWVEALAAVGLRDRGPRLAQPGDPTDNLLMAFEK